MHDSYETCTTSMERAQLLWNVRNSYETCATSMIYKHCKKLLTILYPYIYTYIYIYISADPGLRQGRGGAWDHRRCGSCLSWTLATPNAAGKSHHKATAMAQEHPTAAAMASFIGVQGCRLPGLKPSKPSNSSKSLPNSTGKRYPNKPNTRHARRQKPPQGHSNGSRAPRGRSNGFL